MGCRHSPGFQGCQAARDDSSGAHTLHGCGSAVPMARLGSTVGAGGCGPLAQAHLARQPCTPLGGAQQSVPAMRRAEPARLTLACRQTHRTAGRGRGSAGPSAGSALETVRLAPLSAPAAVGGRVPLANPVAGSDGRASANRAASLRASRGRGLHGAVLLQRAESGPAVGPLPLS